MNQSDLCVPRQKLRGQVGRAATPREERLRLKYCPPQILQPGRRYVSDTDPGWDDVVRAYEEDR